MRTPKAVCVGWALALSLLGPSGFVAAADDEAGFVSIFDSKTLSGWDGNPDLWGVQDGAIVGRTTAEKPIAGNTFLIWRGGQPADFELRLQFRIDGGNSGVQYRSKEVEKWVMSGYQADFDDANVWTGSLYDEKTGRGVLAKRGQQVVIAEDGKKEQVGETTAEQTIIDSVNKDGWNDLVVIAQGNHLVQKLNGLLTVDLVDNQASARSLSGLIALQVHRGPPMIVQFRNIRLKTLKP